MSEIQNNNIPLIKITAPELNQSGYAANLSSTFDNIDKNFATLANYDFIKGESGRSISIVEVPFYEKNEQTGELKLNYYGNLVKSYFENKYDDEKMSINGHDLFDNFTSDNAGTLHLIVERNNNTTDEYTVISSYYYIFLDGRFANDEVGSIDDKSIFEDVEDLSCILIYDKDINGFKTLDNAFPTMYYEKGVGLCWKINGVNTGIAVQGIPGKDGKDAIVQYVECKNGTPVDGNESYRKAEVSGIYEYPNFTSIGENTSKNDLLELSGSSSLILIIDDIDGLHHLYFGQLRFEGEKLYAYYFESTELTKTVDIAEMINILKSISFNSRDYSPLRGLFIPISNEVNNKQPVHLITATDILGEFGNVSSGENADLTLTPIDDINTLEPDDNNKKLLVEKYLYVDADMKLSMTGNTLLKYKLVGTYNKFENLREGYESFKPSLEEILSGITIRRIYFNSNAGNGDEEYSDDSFNSVPTYFKNEDNTDIKTIYHWEIQDSYSYFDKEFIGENYRPNNYNNYEYYRHIFTDTLNPNVSSKIMWFNGIDILDEISENNETYYIISGWSGNEEENVIQFKRLIPVFVNSFKYDGDTSLNINYNVNITGNNNNDSKRDLTVNGSINCDNISVSGEADIREITDDIHMQKNATIDGDIKIGNSIDAYNTIIDTNGNMELKGELQAESAKLSNNLTSKDISSTGTLRFKSAKLNSGNTDLLKIDLQYANVMNWSDMEVTPKPDPGVGERSMRALTLNENDGTNTKGFEQISSDPIDPNPPINNVFNKLNITAELNNLKSIDIQKFNDRSTISSNVTSVNVNSGVVVSNVRPNNNGTFYYDTEGVSKNLKFNEVIDNLKTKTADTSNGEPETENKSKQYEYNGELKSFSINNTGEFDNSTILCKNVLSEAPHKTISLDYNRSEDNYEYKLFSITFNNIDNTDNSYIYALSDSNNITINLGYYTFLVDLHSRGAGKNNDSYWPKLSDESYIIFDAYYKINGSEVKKLDKTLNCTFLNAGEYRWYGYDKNLNIQDRDTNDYIHRYQGYVFKLNDITISTDTQEFKDIKDAYDNGRSIEIFICPSIHMFFNSINGKKIKAAYASKFLPVDSTKYTLSAVQSTKLFYTYGLSDSKKLIIENFDPMSYKWEDTYSTRPRLSYVTQKTKLAATSTTICEDGVAIHSTNYVFGIGIYDTRPHLVYYNNSGDGKIQIISLYDLIDKVNKFQATPQEATVQTEEPENTELPELPE